MGREEYDGGGDGPPEPPWNETVLLVSPGSENWATFVVPSSMQAFRCDRLVMEPTPPELWVLSVFTEAREHLLGEIPSAAFSPTSSARLDLESVERGGRLRVQLDWRREDATLSVHLGVFGRAV
jgi:hypothetical protein